MDATTLDPSVFEAFAATLAKPRREEAELVVERLKALRDYNGPLGDFLAEFGGLVADLFATSSLAVWFRTDEATTLDRKLGIGWENFLLDDPTRDAHQRVLQFCLDNPKPLAFQPYSAGTVNGVPSASPLTVSNPTDSYLLLAPIRFEQNPVAVLEIVLGPKPLRRPHEPVMQGYMAWLGWLSSILESGIRRCFQQSDPAFVAALSVLQRTSLDVDEIQKQIRTHIEESLQQLEGRNFGSLQANQSIAKQVHALLDGKGLRVECPECGSAAILRCQKAGNAKTGAFMFDHYLDSGRTFHGGQTTFPRLKIVDKPPRRKSK